MARTFLGSSTEDLLVDASDARLIKQQPIIPKPEDFIPPEGIFIGDKFIPATSTEQQAAFPAQPPPQSVVPTAPEVPQVAQPQPSSVVTKRFQDIVFQPLTTLKKVNELYGNTGKDLSEIEKGKKPSGGFAEGFAAFTEGFVSATQGRAPRDLTASKDRARRAAASDALSQLLEQGRNKRADNRNNMTKENFKINSELRKQEVAISQERLVGTQKKTEIAQLKEVAKGEQLVDSLLAGANAGILSSTGKKEIAKALPHLSTQAVKAGIAEVEALPEGPERIAKAQEVTQRWLQTPGGTPASQPTSQRPTPEQARAEIERRRREREGR